MMKRLIAALLCLVMLAGFAGFAEEGEWKSILLLGNDTRKFPKFERSDAMIIVSYNREKAKAKLTSIMRDTDVPFASGGSGKINGAMAVGGPENAVATVNKAFGMNIEDYVVVNFRQLIQLVDLIGGIDIDLLEVERLRINEKYKGYDVAQKKVVLESDGMQHLNGGHVLSYSRDRKSTAAGDYDRVKRQRRVLIAILKALQEKTVDEVLELADDMIELVDSSLTNEELLELGKFALTVETDTIGEFRLPADGAFQDGLFNGVWKIKPNLEKNKQLLKDFINGSELKNGSAGENVRKLQQKLTDLGFLNDRVDGMFGSKTAAAVKAAQKQLGVKETGVADEDFLDMLYAQ